MPRATQRGIGGPQPPAMPRAYDPETVYRANGGKVQNYASGGDVTTRYGFGPEINFFPGNSPLPGDEAEAPPASPGIASYAYQPSTQTTYAVVPPDGGGGAGGSDLGAPLSAASDRSLGDVLGGRAGAIGGIGGSLLGGPIGGFLGRGIGTAIDMSAANDRIADFERSMGQPASSPLGVSAWGSAMLNGLTPFGDRLGVGTSAISAEREALANAAMAAPMNNPLTNQEAALLGVDFDQSGGGHDGGFNAGDYSGADTGDYGGAKAGYNAKGGTIRAAAGHWRVSGSAAARSRVRARVRTFDRRPPLARRACH
jgi:hypothetical protein